MPSSKLKAWDTCKEKVWEWKHEYDIEDWDYFIFHKDMGEVVDGAVCVISSDVCDRAFSWVTLTAPWDGSGPLQRGQGWTQGEANSDEGLGHCCPPVSSVAIQGGVGCGLRCAYGTRRRMSLGLWQLCNRLSSGSKGKQHHLRDQLSWAAAALLSPATLALASIIFC